MRPCWLPSASERVREGSRVIPALQDTCFTLFPPPLLCELASASTLLTVQGLRFLTSILMLGLLAKTGLFCPNQGPKEGEGGGSRGSPWVAHFAATCGGCDATDGLPSIRPTFTRLWLPVSISSSSSERTTSSGNCFLLGVLVLAGPVGGGGGRVAI